jgi:hypothetical protein
MVERLAPICFILLFAAAATAQVGVSSRTHDAPESSAASDEVFRRLLYPLDAATGFRVGGCVE